MKKESSPPGIIIVKRLKSKAISKLRANRNSTMRVFSSLSAPAEARPSNVPLIVIGVLIFIAIGSGVTNFIAARSGHNSHFSLSSIAHRLSWQMGDAYQVDSELLGNGKSSLSNAKTNPAAYLRSHPKIVMKQPLLIPSNRVATASLVMRQRSAFVSPQTPHFPSKNLVSRKLIQVIRRSSRKGIDPVGLAQKIVLESDRQDFDPLFVAAVIKSESAFDRMALSNAGARGLMQILPSTGSFIEGLKGFETVMKVRLTDPNYNVRLGISYLKYLEQMYKGNRVLVLTAYNWGPGRVVDAIEGRRRIPSEVMSYALKILKDHQEWVNELLYAA